MLTPVSSQGFEVDSALGRMRWSLLDAVRFSDVHCKIHYKVLLKAGAHACLTSELTVESLSASLELVMLGVKFICQPEAPDAPVEGRENRDIARIASSNEFDLLSRISRLSKTEIAVLECLMQADSNKVIARKLQIAEGTVKVHINSILRKIRAVNRTQAAMWAMTNLDSRAKSEEPQYEV
jgi:two-component system, NarL family, nitrate/nitrite response regulator NarL